MYSSSGSDNRITFVIAFPAASVRAPGSNGISLFGRAGLSIITFPFPKGRPFLRLIGCDPRASVQIRKACRPEQGFTDLWIGLFREIEIVEGDRRRAFSPPFPLNASPPTDERWLRSGSCRESHLSPGVEASTAGLSAVDTRRITRHVQRYAGLGCERGYSRTFNNQSSLTIRSGSLQD